jgi:uncharacterized membrane-anchored protein
MPLPPKGDPARPLHLAASSATVLGVLALLGAGLVTLAIGSAARGNPAVRLGLIIAIAFYVGVGVGFFVLAVFMRRRKAWAVIVTMALVGMLLLLMGVSLLRQAMAGVLAETPVPALITVLIGVALIQMLFHLVKGYKFIQGQSPPPGFAPIMPQPVQPVITASIPPSPPGPGAGSPGGH